MFINGRRRGQRLRLLAVTLALTTFLSASLTFAEEKPTIENEKSNESILNYLEGEDYIFTAERIPTNRWDTPANVHVITAEEIEKNNWQSVDEALSHVNGVTIQANNAVMLNGNPNVVVLIDGQRLDNDDSYTVGGFRHSVNLLVIPSIKMVERIEIVKGGYSALYGADAVGGVVNIITKKSTRNETTFDINAGSWHRYNYELTNQGVAGKFSWFATAGLHRSHPYKYRGGSDLLSDVNDNTLSLRLDNRFDDRSSLTLNFMHRSHDYDNFAQYENETNRYRYDLYNNVSLTYHFKEGTMTPGWLRYFNNYKSYNWHWDEISRVAEYIDEDEFIYRTRLKFRDFSSSQKMQGVDYQNGWELGKHKVIAGFEWHQNKIEDSRAIADTLSEIGIYMDRHYPKMTNRAYYLQDTITFDDKWNFVAGARLDQNSDFGRHWSPKLAVNYRPQDKTKFYAWWGKFYRIPSWQMLFGDMGGFFNLKAETGNTVNVGVEHNFNDKTNLAVNFFDTRRKNPLPYGSFVEISDDNSSLKERGVEISVGHKVNDHLTCNLEYSHTKTIRYIAWHYPQPNGYRLGIHYRNRGLRANLLGIFGAGFDNNFDEQYRGSAYGSKNYAIIDFNINQDLNEYATIYFRAVNIMNQDHSTGSKNHPHSSGRFIMSGATFRF